MYQWYLAILGCEHGSYPGYLLGRVCHIPPSMSGVDLLYAGWIDLAEGDLPGPFSGPDMVALSPTTIARCRSQIELRTVYISHPTRGATKSYEYKPHTRIILTLARETRDALSAQQYTVSLRRPDQAHPTTWLTLSHPDHTISMEYDYTLEDGGKQFEMRAEVKVSDHLLSSASDVYPTEISGKMISWFDSVPWVIWRWDDQVTVSLGQKELAIKVGLQLITRSRYALSVEIAHSSDTTSTAEVEEGDDAIWLID